MPKHGNYVTSDCNCVKCEFTLFYICAQPSIISYSPTMKKIYYLLIFLIPFLHFSQGPPPPGLPDPLPVAAPINQIDSILFVTAIFIGIYFTCKKLNISLIPKKKIRVNVNLDKPNNLL